MIFFNFFFYDYFSSYFSSDIYIYTGNKMSEKQIAITCRQFLKSKGGRSLLLEITINIMKLWIFKITKYLTSVKNMFIFNLKKLFNKISGKQNKNSRNEIQNNERNTIVEFDV